MTEHTEQPNKFVARIPGVLYARLKDEVKRRNMERNPFATEKASLNSLLLDALRKELDGPGTEQRNPVEISAPQFPEKSDSENNAGLSNRDLGIGPGPHPDLPEAHHFRDSAGGWVPPTEEPMSKTRAKILAVIKPTAAELAAKFGVKTLATIEEVEPRCDPESRYIQSIIVADPTYASDDERFKWDFIAEFGRQAWDRAIRIPQFKKAKWPERFEMAREQKERE